EQLLGECVATAHDLQEADRAFLSTLRPPRPMTRRVVFQQAAKVGGLLCASVAGCGVGASMFVFGTSDAIEGATSLHDRYYGVSSRGGNPLRWGFNQISPKWGDLAYDGISFGTNLAALKMPVPLNVGKADGLNRPTTMFGVNVRNINNTKLYPITKGATPSGTHQSTLLFGVGSKGLAVVDDIRELERPE
ncbi:hypothetical protein, partial [Paraburkholderia sp. NMBU_R16]|uniref:hypothetical protein n=1 Tax=Paraburkholderia sp. NMBU_R16 TaxID=2698676 RepID=UPI001C265F75